MRALFNKEAGALLPAYYYKFTFFCLGYFTS